MDLYNISKAFGSVPQLILAMEFNILEAHKALSAKS